MARKSQKKPSPQKKMASPAGRKPPLRTRAGQNAGIKLIKGGTTTGDSSRQEKTASFPIVGMGASAGRQVRGAQFETETSQARYQELYDLAPVGYLTLNRRGLILEINLTGCAMLGRERRYLRNRPVFTFIVPEHRLALKKHLEAVFKKGSRQFSEFLLAGHSSPTWISMESLVGSHKDEEGRVCRSIIVDITARKRAETERHRLLTAVDHSADGIVVSDLQERIIYANPAASEISGYPLQELVGKHLRIFRKGVHEEGVYKRIRSALQLGLPWKGRVPGRRKNGVLYTVRLSITPVEEGISGIVNYVAVFQDISEQITIEEGLRESQKLEAVGTLAGGIAHDFNNILAAIIGFSEMASDDAEKGSRQEQHLQKVLSAALRGRELVRQILTFSRKSEPKKSPVHLSALVDDTLKLLRATLPSSLVLQYSGPKESGFVSGDATQLQQVVVNLCTNAAYAMRETTGVINVELSDFTLSAAERPPIAGLSPGNYVKLLVADTGEGIPKENLDRVFEPFFTTKQPGEGSGLGLSVVHGIVETHRGAIGVTSKPGKGSTFTVYLPRIADIDDQESSEEGVLPTGNERILFIDDEAALAEMAEHLLTDLSYRVVCKTDSREALALFRRNPSRFDLVITDQTMPDITGIQLVKQILAVRRNIPIILCTGFSHQVDSDSARAAGVRAFIQKPLTKMEMARTVRRVLDAKS